MKVLVTGSEGFIGKHLVKRLEAEHEVIRFDIKRSPAEDVMDAPAAAKLIEKEKPDAVVHLAANPDITYSVQHPADDLSLNAVGTVNMLEAVKGAKLKLFVIASTAQVYGEPKQEKMDEDHPLNPKSPYAMSKLAAEGYCRFYHEKYGVPALVFRFFNIYGPDQPTNVVVPNLIRKISASEGKLEMFGSGEDSRDFVYVGDICEAIALALKKLPAGKTINLASGKETRIIDLAGLISKKLGKKTEFTYGAQKEEAKIFRMCGSAEKARRLLGWAPKVSLEDGVAKVIENIRGKP